MLATIAAAAGLAFFYLSQSSHVAAVGHRLRNTLLVRRIVAVVDFVRSRASADALDDQMRSLADADALALEGSYSLLRFITWAIPILGFLGTVLGITQAIAGVTPEVLEHSLSNVTNGLSLAFDATRCRLASGQRSRISERSARNAAGASSRVTSARAAPEQLLEADREAGGKRGQPLECEQDAGHVRLARVRVVADRQELSLAAEEDLLVRDEPG